MTESKSEPEERSEVGPSAPKAPATQAEPGLADQATADQATDDQAAEASGTTDATSGSIVRRVSAIALAVVGMVLLMAWLAGAFRERIQPDAGRTPPTATANAQLITVQRTTVPVTREVTGSIAAEHETTVASQLLGRVVEVNAVAGRRVKGGDVLVRLEEAEHEARFAEAQALLKRAEDHARRIERQYKAGTTTESQLVQARTNAQAARARLSEARSFMEKTKIRAPSTGIVIERLCEVGDTVTPGQPLARLYDRLQLIAIVPESLQPHLRVGQEVGVRVEAMGDDGCVGVVSEIVPRAEALSRSFEVKVTGPCPPGLIPGMFGRMSIDLGTREELRIPARAIRRVGQIPMVFRAMEGGSLLRQFVRLGSRVGDLVVVTSGLEPGDRIVADAATIGASEGARQ